MRNGFDGTCTTTGRARSSTGASVAQRAPSTTTGSQVAAGAKSSRSGVDTNVGPSKPSITADSRCDCACSPFVVGCSGSNGERGYSSRCADGTRMSLPCAISPTVRPAARSASISRRQSSPYSGPISGRIASMSTWVNSLVIQSCCAVAHRGERNTASGTA